MNDKYQFMIKSFRMDLHLIKLKKKYSVQSQQARPELDFGILHIVADEGLKNFHDWIQGSPLPGLLPRRLLLLDVIALVSAAKASIGAAETVAAAA